MTPSNFSYPTLAVLDGVVRYGADPTGVADSQPAFSAASSVGQPFSVTAGTYLINSNLTITPNTVFFPGAILKPAAGVKITFIGTLQAGIYQIFDLSLGGAIITPPGTSEIWVEWYGAQSIPSSKVNNEFAFNAAWWSALTTTAGVYGGKIRFARGDYFISGPTYSSDNISLAGDGYFYSLMKANAGTWSGSYMHQSQNAVPITFTDNAGLGPSAAATSATLSVAWALPTTTYPVVFFERGAAACEQRTVTLTNGLTTATWSGGLTQNCTGNAVALTYTAIFNNTLYNFRMDANDLSAVTACIYAPAWQQQSGMDGMYLSNFKDYGILIDNGYGGAAQLTLKRSQIIAAADGVSGCTGIRVNNIAGTVGSLDINLQEVQFASAMASITFTAPPAATATSATLSVNWPNPSGVWNVLFVETAGGANEYRNVTLTNGANTATWSGGLSANCNATASGVSPNTTGMYVTNSRVNINVSDVHVEQLNNGFDLDGACNLFGTCITSDGSSTVTNELRMESTWTGVVYVVGCRKGGSLQYINDQSRTITGLANVEPINGLLIWPPSAAVPVAACNITGGATPAYNGQQGFGAAPSHVGAGNQLLTLATTMDGTSSYFVVATSMDNAHPQIAAVPASGTTFNVFTWTPAGVAADASEFSVQVYRRPT